MQKQSLGSETWLWSWAAGTSCLPWPLLEGLEGTAGDELLPGVQPSPLWPHQQLQKLENFSCTQTTATVLQTAQLLAISVMFLLHPHASNLSHSLYSFRQFSYSFTEKLADTPDSLCCPFPKFCWFYKQFHSPHSIQNLGIYRVLVITFGVLLSLNCNSLPFFCY